jgi:predicted O-linked N-acetylglucosamine transferase (SPINDLY family)/SAM-dependent methyltransferase
MSTAEGQQCWREGLQLSRNGDWPSAEQAFRRAHQHCPDDTVYLLNLARSEAKNGGADLGLQSLQTLLVLEPANALARKMMVDLLNQQHRYAEAAVCMEQQPEQVPRKAEYFQALGEALFNARSYKQAVSALFEGLSYQIDHALSHYRMGLSFNALGLKSEAIECLRTALVLGLGPGDIAAQGLLAFIGRELCCWESAQSDLAALQTMTAALPANPAQWTSVFAQATLSADPVQLLRAARSCTAFNSRQIQPFPALPLRALPQRLRVGFVSSDLHQHATAILMAEVFEKLDRTRFEVTLYSHGPEDGSAMRQRLRLAAEHFEEVSKASDLEVAQRVREHRIEVLIDLKGHTQDNRLALFAYRPAPVQVTFLGFPGTTGANFIDYFIGDAIVSPLSHAPFYSEKLALLPGCYQPNDKQRSLPGPSSRAQVGLPEGALVLCGFNQPFKLSPEVFDVWCNLLQQLPDAVLWLLQWNDTAPAQLRLEAQARGIDPARLVFAPRVGAREHLSRLALADLFIDTWPCNGHTTASDALWAGVPVITYAGENFASRVAASLLTAVGLPELACGSLTDYRDLVLKLAGDAPARQALREHLLLARDRAPLFDSDRYTKDFGDLLWRMAERWSLGLPAEHLDMSLPIVPSPLTEMRPLEAAAAAAEFTDDENPAMSVSLPEVHLCIVQPGAFVHSLGFLDQARYFRHQFRRMGANVSVAKNRLRHDAVNFVFGAHLGFDAQRCERYSCVFVNLEQLGDGGAAVSPDYLKLLAASAVVDYDAGNVAAYTTHLDDVPLFPLLYAPYLAQPNGVALEDRTIDLLFIGSLNPRRRALIARIEALGLKVSQFDAPLYGPERDSVILQAKAVFNAHFYPSSRFEQARVSHCLSLGTPVISERGPLTQPHPDFEDNVFWIEGEQLEAFFTDRFAQPAFFEEARAQLQRFALSDPIEAYADLLAFAAGFANEHQQRRPVTPWQPLRINLGSGKDYKAGWLNLDVLDRAQPDLVLDLGQPTALPLQASTSYSGSVLLAEGGAELIYANNVLEHVPDLPELMGNCLRLLKIGGSFIIEVPYEHAATAWQDPTHLRALNEKSWLYYTDWFWYLGWFEHRFELTQFGYLDEALKDCEREKASFMRVVLTKIETTLRERNTARVMRADFVLPDDLAGASTD